MRVVMRAGRTQRPGSRAAARPWFALFLAYLLLVQSVLALGWSTQHALAAAADLAPVFCHVEGGADPVSAPGTPDHGAAPLMAPCAICAFASADYTPPVAMGVAPLSRAFVRLDRPVVETPPLLAPVRSTTRLSQGPPTAA